MQIQEKKKIYTYSDYAKLEEGAPYQLIEGELIISPAPRIIHQRIIARLYRLLDDYVEKNKIGEIFLSPVDVYFSDLNTFQPDLVFVSKEKSNIVGEMKIEGAPDLVIEVLSPEHAYYDLKTKKHIYEKYKVKEYWLVDPIESTIEVFTLAGEKFQLFSKMTVKDSIKSNLLKEFKVKTSEVFN